MKSIVKENKPKEIKFPCLMKHDQGTIILATGTGFNGGYEGICVNDAYDTFGKSLDSWSETFKLFNGTVTLEND